MPRTSAAALAITRVDGKATRLEPPSDLGDAERKAFLDIVNACAPDHFVPSDLPVLISFVEATVFCRLAAKALHKDTSMVGVWEQALRAQAQLATKLRLTPQSRTDPKTTGRRAAGFRQPSYYETLDNE